MPGRGAIHLDIVAIAKDMAYLQDFYHAKTAEDKAAVVDKYTREHLDMTADVDIDNDKQRKPEYQNSPLRKRYCKSPNQDKDVRQLAEDCMCHQCNKYCLQSAKTNTNGPRTSESFWNQNKIWKTRHTRASIYKKVQNI